MKIPRAPRLRQSAFGMTAMIDMAFLLITFFVMSIRLGQQGEELVKLPRADRAVAAHEENTEIVTVNVTSAGRYLLGGLERTPSDVGRYLEERKHGASRVEILIRGDRRAPFDSVRRIMRLSVDHGIADVSLAALQLGDEEIP